MAADIIWTVAVTPTLQDVLVLGLIVLIRTCLSISLQVELEGRWPWQCGSTPRWPRTPQNQIACCPVAILEAHVGGEGLSVLNAP